MAKGYGPCRHCLKAFRTGEQRRSLFTYDAFDSIDPLPLPGPVSIHTEQCERYPETAGYPEELRRYDSRLCAYGKNRRVGDEVVVDNGDQPMAIQELLGRSEVEYIHVRDKNAGCYDFRVERAPVS